MLAVHLVVIAVRCAGTNRLSLSLYFVSLPLHDMSSM